MIEFIELTAFVFSHRKDKRPYGTVVFVCQGKTLGNARVDENGMAKLKMPKEKLGNGNHRVVACFAGNEDFAASISQATIKLVK